MSDTVFTSEQINNAEKWLLPEVRGRHRVTSSKADDSAVYDAAGYRSSGSGEQQSRSAKPSYTTAAMTASKFEALEKRARDKGYEEGRSSGYQQGYAEGEERARQLAVEQLAQHRALLDELIQSIGDAVRNEQEVLQNLLSQLVVKVAQAVCARELTQLDDITLSIEKALAALPIDGKFIHITLNPSDLEVVNSIPDFVQPGWSLRSDASVARGGCKVEAGHGRVDFSVDERLNVVVSGVFGDEVSSAQGADKDRSVIDPAND